MHAWRKLTHAERTKTHAERTEGLAKVNTKAKGEEGNTGQE